MRAASIAAAVLMGLLSFLVCFPLVLLVLYSLVDADQLALLLGGVAGADGYASAAVWETRLSAGSFVTALFDAPSFYVLLSNSALYSCAVLVGQFVVAAPAAWAFARYRFRGRDALFFAYVVLMMLPFQVVMLPNYLAFDQMGINNTALAIVLPGIFSAFPVFIMRQFFAAIPQELIDAARLDGMGEWGIFLRIGLPLGAPGIFASLVLGFFEYWSLVEQPLAFLRDQQLWPLSMLMPSISYENVGAIFAAALIAAVPGLLVFALGKDYLEQGIASMTRGSD